MSLNQIIISKKITVRNKGNMMGNAVKVIVAVVILTLGMSVIIPNANAELPSIKVRSAVNLVSPTTALSYYENVATPDNCPAPMCQPIPIEAQPSAAQLQAILAAIQAYLLQAGLPPIDESTYVWPNPDMDMFKDFAIALGANRLPDEEFKKNAFEYVYSNIETAPFFGLKKGILGSILDQNGTAFDQAKLLIGILKQDTSIVATPPSYQYGTITLSNAQAANWLGVAYMLNGIEIFDASALQNILRDGGIPAVFSGNNVTISHVWVKVGSDIYDPSYKVHAYHEGIAMDTALGCATITCGEQVKNAAMTGAGQSTQSGVSYVQSVNNVALGNKLSELSGNFINYIKANHPNASLLEIVGGKEINLDTIPNKANSGTRTVSRTWTDIPNLFRTTLRVQFDNINKIFFVDEMGGKRLYLTGSVGSPSGTSWTRNMKLNIVGMFDEIESSRVGATKENDDLTIEINHPYAAKKDTQSSDGNYMDTIISRQTAIDETVMNSTGGLNAIATSVGTSSTIAVTTIIAETAYISPAKIKKYSDAIVPSVTYDFLYKNQPVLTTTWLAQVSEGAKLVDSLSNTRSLHHHTIGYILSDSTTTIIHGEGGYSIVSEANSSASESAAATSIAHLSSRMEGSIFEQVEGVWDGASSVSMFEKANQKAIKFFDVDSVSDLSVLNNYSSSRQINLQNYINSGYELIVPQSGVLGDFSLIGGTLNVSTAPFYAYNTVDKRRAFIIQDKNKGSTALGLDNPNETIPKLAETAINSLKSKDYIGVDESTGVLRLTPESDMVTGQGSFPYSLGFKRAYSSNQYDKTESPFVLYQGFVDTTFKIGNSSPYLLGSGWSHNFEIMAQINSDAMQAFGADSVLDATALITSLYTLMDLDRNVQTFSGRVSAIFVANWFGDQLRDNAVVITIPPSSSVFIRLPDGSYNPPPGNYSKLVVSGTKSAAIAWSAKSVRYSYDNYLISHTDENGNMLTFSSAGFDFDSFGTRSARLPSFNPTVWNFANGMVVNFDYLEYTFQNTNQTRKYLSKVRNSLGRFLSFTHTPFANGKFKLSQIEDDNGRKVLITPEYMGYTILDQSPKTLTVTLPDGAEQKYSYEKMLVGGTIVSSNKIRAWYTPSDLNTPFMSIDYSPNKRVKSVTDILGNQTVYFIGSLSNENIKRSDRQDALGNVYSTYFDKNGSVIRSIDPLGAEVVNKYDNSFRLIKSVFPEGNSEIRSYNTRGNLVETCQRSKTYSGTQEFTCDRNVDLVTTATYPTIIYPTTCTNYKVCNKPTSLKDPNGNITDVSYFQNTGLLEWKKEATVNGVRSTTTYVYNTFGQLTSVTDPELMVISYDYDTIGNHNVLKTITVDAGDVTHNNIMTSFGYAPIVGQGVTYGNWGAVTTITDPRNNPTNHEYDPVGRRIKSIAPDGSFGKNIFDLDGQLVRTEKYANGGTVPLQVTETDYTLTGQVDKTYDPECFDAAGVRNITLSGCDITTTTYDVLGRPDIVTDGEGRKTQTIYFADGKTDKIIRALGTALQQNYATYTYTLSGQEASVKDANGNLTEYFYDGFDRLNKFQLPHPSNTGQSNPADYEQYTYDANGNMTIKRKRDGKTIANTYDALNRVTQKSPQGQSSVSYSYDLVGRQTDVDFVGGGHSIQHSYDTVGRLIATNDNGRTLSYQYADKVNRTRITWPDGYSADYAYDNLNRVTTIKENGAGILATYAYDVSGRRASLTLGNGTITSYSYHDDDALNTLSHNVNGSADDVDWTYGFNKVNQLTSKAISNALYEWLPSYARNDAYQSNGLNQYANVAGTGLSYDLNGNLTSDGVWLYNYDTENMLLNASRSGASASYLYDPLGRRSAKTVDTVLTSFLNDGVEEIADYNAGGTLLRRYVHGPGVDEYLVMYTGSGTANKSYFHANHQGSIVAMSDSAGNVTEQHSYDSYGNSDNLTGNPFRYTGRRLDAETGLYYYRARYYSPAIGRFLQTDPIGYGDGLNWYAYVGNDPVNLNDPTGMCPSISSNCLNKSEKRTVSTRSNKEDNNNPLDFSEFFKTRPSKQLDDFYPDTVDTTGNPSFDKELPAGINLLRVAMNEFNRIQDQYANTNVGLIYTDKFSNISKHVLVGTVLRNDGSFGRTVFPSNTQGVIIGISMGGATDFATQDISAAMQRLTFRYNVPVAVVFRDSSRYPGTVIFRRNKSPAMLKK